MSNKLALGKVNYSYIEKLNIVWPCIGVKLIKKVKIILKNILIYFSIRSTVVIIFFTTVTQTK